MKAIHLTVCLAAAAVTTHGGEAPVILQHPQSVMVMIGDSVRLTCVVTGTPPIAFIWQKDGAFLGDQTNATLVISNAQPAHSGRYRLTASNDDGLTRSDAAKVCVYTNQPCNYPWVWLHVGKPSRPCYSYVAGLAVDTNGNTFLTGPVCSDDPLRSDYDILTVKLAPDGRVIWQARYDDHGQGNDTPTDLTIDAEGNCYVVGTSYRQQSPANYDDDYVTIKHTSEGQIAWVAIHNSTTNKVPPLYSSDQATAIRVDALGFVYATGGSGTVKYSPFGQPVWTNRLPAFFLELAGNGTSVYVAAGIPQTGLVLLDSSGEQVWQWPIEHITKLAVDREGNPHLLLRHKYTGQANIEDIEMVKISPQGGLVWSAVYDSPFHLGDQPSSMAIDTVGQVYVAGIVGKPDGSTDSVVLKYSPAGHELWSRIYNDVYGNREFPYAIAVDAEGGVYVAGDTSPTPEAWWWEALLVKYDSLGNLLWTSRYRSKTVGNYSVRDYFTHLAVLEDGRIVAAGRATLPPSGSDRDGFLAVGYDQRTPRLWLAGVPAPGVRQGCLVSPRWTAFDILAATNLNSADWQNIGTVTNYNGLVPFFDPAAGQHPMRFYRARQAP